MLIGWSEANAIYSRRQLEPYFSTLPLLMDTAMDMTRDFTWLI